VGDLAEAAGPLLPDGSLAPVRVTLNSLGNLLGVFSHAEDTDLLVHVVYHNPVIVYAAEATRVHTEARTAILPAVSRGGTAVRLAEVPPGDYVLCNGYRTRAGEPFALQVTVEGHAANLPEWLARQLEAPG
jgi:hypothetical protein